jgi:hypothetical protein
MTCDPTYTEFMSSTKATNKLQMPSRTDVEAAFLANRTNYVNLLERITKQMTANAKAAAGKPRRWDMNGTEGAINMKLAEVLAMLGDPSACRDLGIDY